MASIVEALLMAAEDEGDEHAEKECSRYHSTLLELREFANDDEIRMLDALIERFEFLEILIGPVTGPRQPYGQRHDLYVRVMKGFTT